MQVISRLDDTKEAQYAYQPMRLNQLHITWQYAVRTTKGAVLLSILTSAQKKSAYKVVYDLSLLWAGNRITRSRVSRLQLFTTSALINEDRFTQDRGIDEFWATPTPA